MPITDPEKKRIAQQARLVMRICFKCGCRNDMGQQDVENAEIHI